MGNPKGASKFPSLMKDAVLYWPGETSAVTTTAKTLTNTSYDGPNSTQVTTVTDPWGLARPVGYFTYQSGLTVPAQSTMVYTGDYTIEFYVHCGLQSNIYPSVIYNNTTNDWGTGGVCICIDRDDISPNKATIFSYGYSSSTPILISTSSINNNQWHHIAISRSGTTVRLFIDGDIEDSETSNETVSFNLAVWEIGNHVRGIDASFGPGYLSEMRFSNCARYVTNFSLPTSRSKPDAYTNLLLHMYGSGAVFTDDPFVDVNEFPIIPSGVAVTPNGTFTKDDLGNNKSVVKFDGSTNKISLLDNTAWDLWTSTNTTFCVWIRYNQTTTFKAIIQQKEEIDKYWYVCGVPSTGELMLVGRASSELYAFNYTCPFTQVSDTWYHITIVKSGSSCLMYINGESQTVTVTQAWSALSCNAPLEIGLYATIYYAGNIKDLFLYNRALTQPEIKLLMNRTHPVSGEGLLPGGYDYYRDVV